MTNSIVSITTQNGKYEHFSTPDCCETLGRSVMAYTNKGNKAYSYVVVIPLLDLTTFFHNKENLEIYMRLLASIFGFRCRLVEDPETIFKGANSAYPIKENFYIEIISNTKVSNKHLVAFHTCLRYLWYPNLTNIAIIAVNLFKLGVLDDPIDILAMANSFQPSAGRALLNVALTDTDAFIYFIDRDRILAELAKDTYFNTAFFKCPIYYSPLIEIRGNFFDDSPIIRLSAKNLLASLGGVDEIEEIPPVILKAVNIAMSEYMTAKSCVEDIYRAVGTNFNGMSKTILTKEHIDKRQIDIKHTDLTGHIKVSRIQFTKSLISELTND